MTEKLYLSRFISYLIRCRMIARAKSKKKRQPPQQPFLIVNSNLVRFDFILFDLSNQARISHDMLLVTTSSFLHLIRALVLFVWCKLRSLYPVNRVALSGSVQCLNGAWNKTRTCDLPVNSRMLYRLSYSGISSMPIYNSIPLFKTQIFFS